MVLHGDLSRVQGGGVRVINEQRYYDALKRITKRYLPAARLLRDGQKLYGVSGEEALDSRQ